MTTETTKRTETERKVLIYTLHFAGLFGRNRKAKRDSEKLAEVPLESGPLSEEKVRELAAAKLKEIRPKGALNVAVVEHKETVTEYTYPDGVTMVSRAFELFGGKTLYKETVGA